MTLATAIAICREIEAEPTRSVAGREALAIVRERAEAVLRRRTAQSANRKARKEAGK